MPPNPHSGEWRWSFLAKARKLRPGLWASIAHYRYQAKYFNGQPDGKIAAVPRENKRFQAITSAGDSIGETVDGIKVSTELITNIRGEAWKLTGKVVDEIRQKKFPQLLK